MNNKEMKESSKLSYIGISLVLLSIMFTIILSTLYPKVSQITTFIASLISTAGVALIIIDLVESRYLRKSLQKTSDRIVEKSTCNLDQKFEETFEILEHSKYNGLIDILAPRQDEDRGKETRDIIAREVKESRLIHVFSISGLDFFRAPIGARISSGSYYSVIWKRIETAKTKNEELDLKMKILLMNPKSEAARFREAIETFEAFRGNIEGDIEEAMDGIQRLNAAAEKEFIEYNLYSIFPQVGFVLTESSIFIEPYHFAPTQDLCNALKEKNLKSAEMDNNCTGGRIPILQFDSNSNMYVAIQKHFESIWKLVKNQHDNLTQP